MKPFNILISLVAVIALALVVSSGAAATVEDNEDIIYTRTLRADDTVDAGQTVYVLQAAVWTPDENVRIVGFELSNNI